jgi:hypothetical protein
MLILSNYYDFPKNGASYIGIHSVNNYLLLFISLLILTTILLSSLFLSNLFICYFNIKINLSNNTRNTINSKFIIAVFIFWGVSILIARSYGVEMPYEEELTGIPRYIIYGFYRGILPLISAFIILRTDFILYPIIISIIYSFLSFSRMPFFLIFAVLIINLISIKNYKKLFFILLVFLFCNILISFFRYKINAHDVNLSILLEDILKEFRLILIYSPYDFITTFTSRIVSHVDMLLIWNWDVKNVFFLYLNKFWGLTTSKYNFSLDMQNLFMIVPGEFRMNAIGPFGIIVALAKQSLFGSLFSIIGVSTIIIFVQLAIYNASKKINLSSIESEFLKLLIFIEWLWMSAHMALITIIFILFISILISKNNFIFIKSKLK